MKVSREHFGTAVWAAGSSYGGEKTGETDFDFICDNLTAVSTDHWRHNSLYTELFLQGCEMVSESAEWMCEKNPPSYVTSNPDYYKLSSETYLPSGAGYGATAWKDTGFADEWNTNSEINEWFNFKGVPHSCFGLISQNEFSKNPFYYLIDMSEWTESEARKPCDVPNIQNLFQQTVQRHILIKHKGFNPALDGTNSHDVLVSYFDIKELRDLGCKFAPNSKWDYPTKDPQGYPLDHFSRAKHKVKEHEEGYNGYYTPEFVLTFSIPSVVDRPNSPSARGESNDNNPDLFSSVCIAVTSNKMLEDLLAACDPEWHGTESWLNCDMEYAAGPWKVNEMPYGKKINRKILDGQTRDWKFLQSVVPTDVSWIHTLLNETLLVLSHSIRREVRESSSVRDMKRGQGIAAAIEGYGKVKNNSDVIVLPKISYTNRGIKNYNKTDRTTTPHDRSGGYVRYSPSKANPSGLRKWRNGAKIKGGAAAAGTVKKGARVIKNNAAK